LYGFIRLAPLWFEPIRSYDDQHNRIHSKRNIEHIGKANKKTELAYIKVADKVGKRETKPVETVYSGSNSTPVELQASGWSDDEQPPEATVG